MHENLIREFLGIVECLNTDMNETSQMIELNLGIWSCYSGLQELGDLWRMNITEIVTKSRRSQ